MATGLGVDFSPRYQKDTPIPAGTEYAWIKIADGGAPYRTVAPDAMVARFKARSIPIGGYSYAQPGDGALHARVLLAEARRLGALDLVPVIDIESDASIHTWGVNEAITYGKAFCDEVIRQGLRPGVYMNDSMAGACRPDLWPQRPVLWIARYGAKPVKIPRYDVHQFSSSPVDQNQSYTNAHFLASAGTNQEADDMDDTQARQLAELQLAVYGTANTHPGLEDRDESLGIWGRVTDIQEKVNTLLAAGGGGTAPVIDYDQLAAALLRRIANPTA